MEQQKEFLGTAPLGKLVVKLAIPTVIAQLVNLLYNIVDRIYIGRYDASGNLLTAIGVCLPIITMITAVMQLGCFGASPKASYYMGKKDNAMAERIIGSCFAFVIATSIILSVGLFAFAEPILHLVGASENTIGPALEYTRIYVCGTIFMQVAIGMNVFITAQGFTKVSMLSVIIGAVFNIILDPIFIFGFDMGVKGAALATVISQAISAIWVLKFLFGKKAMLRLRKEYIKLDFRMLLPCLALGLSPFIMTATESLLTVTFNTSLRTYGGDLAVGAMTILSTMLQFCVLPLVGFSQGVQPITSYNYGAGKLARVRSSIFMLIGMSVGYSMILATLVILMPEVFVKIFTQEPALIEYSAWALRIYFMGTFLLGIQIACQQTFIALGNAKTSLCLALLRKVVLLIPLIYILPRFFEDKAFAVFLAEPVTDFAAIITTAIVFYIQCKGILKKDITQNQ